MTSKVDYFTKELQRYRESYESLNFVDAILIRLIEIDYTMFQRIDRRKNPLDYLEYAASVIALVTEIKKRPSISDKKVLVAYDNLYRDIYIKILEFAPRRFFQEEESGQI